MSIKLLFKLPRNISLAFSGGLDSLAIAHYLSNNHNVTLLHFNHGCEFSNTIETKCREYADRFQLPIIVGNIQREREKNQNLEDYWRRNRYQFLRSFKDYFVTAHHLDDAVEGWVMSSMHGESKLIPAYDKQVLRPFLITEKESLEKYSQRHCLFPVKDPYNYDLKLTRNYVRANMMEHVYRINPGINKVIRKKYLAMKYNVVN